MAPAALPASIIPTVSQPLSTGTIYVADSQLLETTAEPIKLIHANYIDTAFATLAISSSNPALKSKARRIFVRRIAQLPSTSIHSIIFPRS